MKLKAAQEVSENLEVGCILISAHLVILNLLGCDAVHFKTLLEPYTQLAIYVNMQE